MHVCGAKHPERISKMRRIFCFFKFPFVSTIASMNSFCQGAGQSSLNPQAAGSVTGARLGRRDRGGRHEDRKQAESIPVRAEDTQGVGHHTPPLRTFPFACGQIRKTPAQQDRGSSHQGGSALRNRSRSPSGISRLPSGHVPGAPNQGSRHGT